MNDRRHWGPKARLTRTWREAAHIGAYVSLGAGRCIKGLPPCQVRVCFPVKTAHKRDASNMAPTIKAIIDGLTDAGLWPDDNTDWVEVMDPTFAKGATEVVVELIPRTQDAA